MSGGSPDMLSARLDAVSSTLSETSRWMDQHSELFSDMASSDFDSSVPVPAVPRLPGEEEEAARTPPPPRPRQGQRQR